MCIYAVPNADAKDGFEMILVPPDRRWWMNEQDVMIGMTTVSFDPPENMSREDMAIKAVETLKDKQKQIMAESQMRINKLQERINQLLLITHHKPEAQNDSDSNVIVGEFKKEAYDDDIPF